MIVKSKKLSTIPLDELAKMNITPDEVQESLLIKDTFYDETPTQSLEREKDNNSIHTEKNLDEQEAELKKDNNEKSDSYSEIEDKRLRRKIEVEQSIAAFEESKREKKRKEDFLTQIEKIKEASMSQLYKMREREVKYRLELKQALLEGKDTEQISKNYIDDQNALLYNNDSMSMYMSMPINDTIQNSTLDENGNLQMDVKEHIFGRTSHSRQKSILINGQPIMIDEDIANMIQAKRSPLLSGHLVSNQKENDLTYNKEANGFIDLAQIKNTSKESFDYKLEFDKMMDGLSKDRNEMTNIINNTYVYSDKLKYAYDDGMTYKTNKERELDTRPKRDLPKAALTWGIMYEQELLAYGRRLPRVNDNMVLSMHQLEDIYSY